MRGCGAALATARSGRQCQTARFLDGLFSSGFFPGQVCAILAPRIAPLDRRASALGLVPLFLSLTPKADFDAEAADSVASSTPAARAQTHGEGTGKMREETRPAKRYAWA